MCTHVQEFGVAPGDENVLPQGSKNEDRVFLRNVDERRLIKKLATSEISGADFLNENLNSQNGQLIVDLIRHVIRKFPDGIPEPSFLLEREQSAV